MNKNISPIAASVMTFNGLAMIEAALERDLRVLIYKEDNDSSTPDSGPFRIKVMPYPLENNSQVITASGATLAEAMDDLGTATLEILDEIIPDIFVKKHAQFFERATTKFLDGKLIDISEELLPEETSCMAFPSAMMKTLAASRNLSVVYDMKVPKSYVYIMSEDDITSWLSPDPADIPKGDVTAIFATKGW